MELIYTMAPQPLGKAPIATTKKLTDCPTNLKEAIDWILRVTESDAGGIPSLRPSSNPSGTQKLADALEALLGSARDPIKDEYSKALKGVQELLKNALSANRANSGVQASTNQADFFTNGYSNKDIVTLITNLTTRLRKLIGYKNGSHGDLDGTGIGRPKGNTSDCSEGLKYETGTLIKVSDPRWSYGNISTENDALCTYLQYVGYPVSQLNVGKNVAELLGQFFDEFNDYAAVKGRYSIYIDYVLKNAVDNATLYNDLTSKPLVYLHIATKCYFQHKQSNNNPKYDSKPRTIREMLYWLMALPYSPV
ncbi:uncharacterized protein BXIN_0749 [Babesia sp. Xinjiang]|uniref:uncharacterized protein n=1 Tax=Babesia sp. Xinjiang TaxID=462227 RepID=UPI000A258DA1|nr:uncharacterized protein BXIN_0749 [Babesia sp. Xinjiang]ORM41379.1 hypothetical protein BXIN_0749 [Babesia sp. Xinjiang]